MLGRRFCREKVDEPTQAERGRRGDRERGRHDRERRQGAATAGASDPATNVGPVSSCGWIHQEREPLGE